MVAKLGGGSRSLSAQRSPHATLPRPNHCMLTRRTARRMLWTLTWIDSLTDCSIRFFFCFVPGTVVLPSRPGF